MKNKIKNKLKKMENLNNKLKDILKKISEKEAGLIMELSASNVISIQIDEFFNLNILQRLKKDIENRLMELKNENERSKIKHRK